MVKPKASSTDDLRRRLRALTDPAGIDPAQTFAVVEDTREQDGWSFAPTVPTVRATLATGDYAVLGLETEIAIERKSLGDLVSSITWGNDRFQRELERLRSFKLAAVMIEASPADVDAHRYHAPKVEPAQVFALVAALHVKHGIPFMFGGSRRHAASAALLLMYKYWQAKCAERRELERRDLEAALLKKGAPDER